jgi:HEAT repeat protein
VEALRLLLSSSPQQGQPLRPAEQEARRQALQTCVQKIKSLTDLSRAISLSEWLRMDMQPGVPNTPESVIQNELTKSFETRVRSLLQKPDDPKVAAVATLLGEMAVSARGTHPVYQLNDPSLQAKLAAFAPDLITASREAKAPAARAAIARTLGKLEADPKVTAAALKRLLTDEKEVAVARSAADALVERIGVSQWGALEPQGGIGGPGFGLGRETAVMERLLVPVAATGLGHTDTQVRKSCLDAIRLGARTATDLMPDPQYAPVRNLPLEAGAQLNDLATSFQQLTLELQAACKPLSATLDANNQEVSVAACRALEEIAEVRRKLGGASNKAAEALTKALRDSGVVAKLARKLSDKEARVQLAAIYVLETLEAEAAPAAKEVAVALADPNPYVRWGAARTAGRMAPQGAGQAVTPLAKLLADEHEDVRLTALAALERYGPAAKDAVPALVQTVKKGETAERQSAMTALIAVGANAIQDRKEVVGSALRDTLKDKEAEVRLTAVRALGRLDPTTKESIEALRGALHDTDANVRRAASEALLAD